MIKCISEVKKQKQDIISDMNRLSTKQERLRLNCQKKDNMENAKDATEEIKHFNKLYASRFLMDDCTFHFDDCVFQEN